MEDIQNGIDIAAKIIEILGLSIIFFGVSYSVLKFFFGKLTKKQYNYKELRVSLGKCLLLGLEILIAADIMATVVTKPNLNSVIVLGLIVLIRIILSLSLQVELEGQFPWQRSKKKDML